MNKKRPIKIVVTNIVSLNPGDAAILSGMFKIFEKKYGDNCEIIVYDKSSEVSAKYYTWAKFRQSLFSQKKASTISKFLDKSGYGHWNLRLRYIKLCIILTLIKLKLKRLSDYIFCRYDTDSVLDYCSSDLIVSTGGTYLVENYGLWPAIYDYRMSLKTKTPLIFFTQSLGPYRLTKNKKQLNYIFSRSFAIYLRDQQSKENLLKIGVPEKLIKLSKDAAFVLETKSQKDKIIAKPKDILKIAISVRSLTFFYGRNNDLWENYVACIQSMIIFAVRELKAEITFLSTCQGIPEYWTDDSATAKEICRSLPDDVRNIVIIDSIFRQPIEVIDAYVNFDLVIATRMHAAILAIKAETPVIGIAYEFKMEELFDQLEMKDLLLSIRNINEDSAVNTLINIVNDKKLWRDHVTVKSKKFRKEAFMITDHLPNILR